MKRIYAMTVILGALGWTAAAQDTNAQQVELKRAEADMAKRLVELTKTAFVSAGVMGQTVKGAAYSGVEITETTQVLGDGTRIHNERQTMVYRDSEGRVRRETPNEITIWDPVANTSYVLNPKQQTARQMPLGRPNLIRTGEPARIQTFALTGDGLQPAEKLVVLAGRGGRGGFQSADAKPQSLGHQVMEGVDAVGERITSTIAAGAIGNDRPIEMVSEHWDSPDLQTTIKNVHSDPRTGEETFRLTNISRVEPAPYLFQIPAGYQVIERK